MATDICDRSEVQRLVAAGALLAEALPREEYDHEHIAGAVSLPLREIDEERVASMDRTRPVIVYCNDFT